MNIFQRAVSAIKSMFISSKSIENIYGIPVAISSIMLAARHRWRNIAQGKAEWNIDDVVSQRLANLISQEIASMAAYGSKSEITGGESEDSNGAKTTLKNPRSEWLNDSYQTFIENDLQNAITAALNSGELILKPSQSIDGVSISICDTDFYWPLAYNFKGELTDVVFGATANKDKYTYKLLERHTFSKQTKAHAISYLAFRTEQSDMAWNPDALGEPANIADIPDWAGLKNKTITNIDRPLYVHIKMPLYDSLERPQRQGMPIWSKAVDAIREADIHSARMRREMKDTELALVINANKYMNVGGTPAKFGKNGEPAQPAQPGKMKLPDGDGRKFIAVGADDAFAVDVFNPAPRVEEYMAYMNRIEREIERLSNLSYGVISDNNEQTKTAEEFKKSHRKTITMVGTIQMLVFEPALKHLVESLNVLADLMGVPYGEYSVLFDWDDSYATDRTAEGKERLEWQRMGNLSVQENRAWWFNTDVDDPVAQDVPATMTSEF